MSDRKILGHITAPVDEEHRLRDGHAARPRHLAEAAVRDGPMVKACKG